MKGFSLGIDISKDHFHTCLCITVQGQQYEYSSVKKWDNNKAGFVQLEMWLNTKVKQGCSVKYLMEATGIYHEKLAYYLHGKSKTVHVVLPNTSKHFFNSLNIKTKTDKLDAKVLARFCAERSHRPWHPPKLIFRQLKELTRYKNQLQQQKNALLNIGHSHENSAHTSKLITQSNKRIIKQIDQQISKVKTAIEELIASDVELAEQVRKLCTIKGCQVHTIASIIAETGGFESFNSRKQLASFAGYDVVHHQSGKSILKKSRISKKGNRFIRAALYYPAMSASMHIPEFKALRKRIIDKTHIKMKAQVAIQRKLLLLIYSMWKSGEEYQTDYNQKKVAKAKAMATQDSSIAAASLRSLN